MAKITKIKRIAKLELIGGQAKPGPELASIGIDMGGFTKEFNDATRERQGDVVPAIITAYEDRSFSFVLKTTPAAVLIKKHAKLDKGSQKPGKEVAGSISIESLKEIAQYKMEDLNTNNLDAAISMLKGQCRNMGIEIEDQNSKPIIEVEKN